MIADWRWGGGKIHSISAIRFFAMVCIIACHFCQYYELEAAWWLNVGVQIFFIISGFLYGNKEISGPITWVIKQFKKILIPYYIFLLFAIVGYAIVAPERLGIKNVIAAILTVGQIKGIGHLWFVSNILFCYIVTPYLAALRDYLKNRSLWQAFLIIIGISVIYSLIGILTNAYFRPEHIICYVLGFFTAVICKKYGNKVLRWFLWLSLIPCTLSNILFCYLRYFSGSDNGHVTDYAHMFLGYSITIILMVLLKNIKDSKVLRFSDKYSYEIYITHQLFILSPLSLLRITTCNWFNIVITVIAIGLTGVLLHKISKLTIRGDV